jgi:DNA-binding response OmpR family regulator
MRKQILVVENDRILLEMMKLNLESKGYHVRHAEDGVQALNAVEQNKIDLIISDIMMPNMTGLGLLKLLHENHFENIPVIVMSSNDQKKTIASAKEWGAHDYIVKPINFAELCEKISFLLQNEEPLKQNLSKNKKN